MCKLLLILGLLFLIGCEYKTINVQEQFTTEDAIVVVAKHWTSTDLEYNAALKMTLPRTEDHYKTIIRSTVTGQDYDFNGYRTYREFKDHQNCKAMIQFKHTIKTQQNQDYEKRVLRSVRVQNVYLVED